MAPQCLIVAAIFATCKLCRKYGALFVTIDATGMASGQKVTDNSAIFATMTCSRRIFYL